ncbi:MAG: CopG family transcriptional regulator [Clostridia bacterium]|nr:CopG family transcriptional regulator [Clostridia bacterium]
MNDEKLIVTPKRPKGDDGYRTFSIRIREELVKRIDEISAQSGRSRNELIGLFWTTLPITAK